VGGQSLAEFTIIAPILVLVAIAAGMMSLGAHRAHLLSNAVQQATLQKWEFSDTPAAISVEILQAAMNQGGLSASFNSAPLVDSLRVVDSDPYTSLLIGTKAFQPSLALVPGFTVNAAQAINRNLLLSANDGRAVVHPAAPWVPGGAPVAPPW
jgi:hypothetical protein